jgi:hypothetical protein
VKSAKVVIELVFRGKRIPKQVLEQMVMELHELGDELCAPYHKHGDELTCHVYYEDFSGIPQVSVLDAFHKPDILGWFRLGRKSHVGKT